MKQRPVSYMAKYASSRTLTGAWIETSADSNHPGHAEVAPSRVRGLKPCVSSRPIMSYTCRTLTGAWIETAMRAKRPQPAGSRTLTGAWIETPCPGPVRAEASRRTLTGAWIETGHAGVAPACLSRRTLTGAWIETPRSLHMRSITAVAPSRVRGLKPASRSQRSEPIGSHPHGCVA